MTRFGKGSYKKQTNNRIPYLKKQGTVSDQNNYDCPYFFMVHLIMSLLCPPIVGVAFFSLLYSLFWVYTTENSYHPNGYLVRDLGVPGIEESGWQIVLTHSLSKKQQQRVKTTPCYCWLNNLKTTTFSKHVFYIIGMLMIRSTSRCSNCCHGNND